MTFWSGIKFTYIPKQDSVAFAVLKFPILKGTFSRFFDSEVPVRVYHKTKLLTMYRVWILILATILIAKSEDPGIMWMKSAKCKINPEFIYLNYTCFAKSYSRNVSTMTYYLAYRKPLTHLFVRIRKLLRNFGLICCLPVDGASPVQVRSDLLGRSAFSSHRSMRTSRE